MGGPASTTERLYYGNARTREFEARVLAVETEYLVLDRTSFYPEGGGQPGDRGYIGNVSVLDTRTSDAGEIRHVIAPGTAGDLQPGQSVSCRLDWDWRFDFMQQHTGQHVLSASFLRVAGLATVSVHQGLEYTTIELDGDELPEHVITAVEDEANAVIARNLPVQAYEVSEADVPGLNLRRAPKVSGRIRIVEIPDIDRVACGGVHTETTGEVQLVRLCAVERIRGRVRYAWYIGQRAHAHHRFARDTLAGLSTMLSVPAGQITSRVDELDRRIKEAERQISGLQELLAKARAAELYTAAAENGGTPTVVVSDLGAVEPSVLRVVSESLSGYPDTIAVLMARQGERFMWSVAHGSGLRIDAQAMRRDAFPLAVAKGGGKPPIWQGALETPEHFPAFADTVVQLAEITGSTGG